MEHSKKQFSKTMTSLLSSTKHALSVLLYGSDRTLKNGSSAVYHVEHVLGRASSIKRSTDSTHA